MYSKEDAVILIWMGAAFGVGLLSAAVAWHLKAATLTLLLILTAIGGLYALFVFSRNKRNASGSSKQGSNDLNERVEEMSLIMKYRDHQLLKEKNYCELRSRLTKRANSLIRATIVISLFIYGSGLFVTHKIYTANDEFTILIGSGILAIMIAPVLIASGFIHRGKIHDFVRLLRSQE